MTPRVGVGVMPERWWVVEQSVVLEFLRRANRGEDPDLLLLELEANSRIEPTGDEE